MPDRRTFINSLITEINPKNWGVPDYSYKGSRAAAYAAARKAGEKEFIWNNKRFHTLNSGTASQQFNMYGNTNAMIMSKADTGTKEKIFKDSFRGNNMDAEALERSFVLNTLSGTPSYKHPAVHPIQEEAYAKFRKQPLEKSKKELMDEYRNIGGSKIRPAFNAFTNTIYGNSNIAETAHAYRNTEKSEILSFIKDYIKYPFFSKERQLDSYTNRDHFEFDTHRIVEPILDSYLFGEIEKEEIPLYIEKLREQNQNYLSDKNNPKHTFNINDLTLYYPYNKKSSKYKISRLQKELSERGYQLPKSTKEDGTFDGVWGDETKKALVDWQTKESNNNKLPQKLTSTDNNMNILQNKKPFIFPNNLPQYGFGSWLKENAGMVGTIAGGGLGMLIGNPMLGASIGGSIGGAVQQKNTMEVANQEQADLLAKQTGIQTALTNAQNMNLPTYGANFATGGNLNFKSPAAYKAWLAYGHASGEFAKTPGHQKVSIKGQPKKVQHAMGGLIDSLACGGKLKAMGGTLEASDKLDGITLYQNGGTHEESKLGGVPIGRLGRVEEGEVRYNNYVFSNRF